MSDLFDDSDDAGDSALRTQLMNVVYGGRWRVDGPLGQGGMGNVFRGTDLETNEPVAIKTLALHLVDDPEFLKRFEREAGLSRRLSHPALPAYRAFGQHEGMPYFVMTVVEGRTLRELLDEEQKPDTSFVFTLLAQLADVLGYLHEQGVVHRDLKPDNLLLGAGGKLSLVDFGISAQVDVTRLTRPGRLIGTPFFMAPEAIKSGHATPASDVYAMGLLAFMLLTGEHPFSKEDRASMLTRQMSEVPRLAHLVDPKVSEPAARVLSRALEKGPSARYASAPEFVRALQQAWRPEPRPPVGGATVADETIQNDRPLAGGDAPTTRDPVRSIRPVTQRPGPRGTTPRKRR